MKAAGHRFPGKLLLFGEYSVVTGGDGLIIPLNRFGAFWQDVETISEETAQRIESGQELIRYHQWLTENSSLFYGKLDLAQMGKDLKGGSWIASDIPRQYGTGSSGAVVAAVFHRYASEEIKKELQNPGKIIDLKAFLAQMEVFFHGKSSGMDPLCIYLNQAHRISGHRPPHPVSIPEAGANEALNIFLVDTGRSSSTGPLVKLFLEKMKDPVYAGKAGKTYNHLNRICIDETVSNGLSANMMPQLRNLSMLESEIFRTMIPDLILPLWYRGVMYDRYVLKLLGSGGGGYLLGFTLFSDETRKIFHNQGFEVLFLSTDDISQVS